MATSYTNDALNNIRKLPKDIIQSLPGIIVNRQGSCKESYMVTEDFIGYAEHKKAYQLTFDGLNLINDGRQSLPLPEPTIPPHTVLKGQWIARIDFMTEDVGANILGGNGRYTLANEDDDVLEIKIADCTESNLAWYGCSFLKELDLLYFDTTGNLPISIVSIGQEYVNGYLLDPHKGGGEYLEVHDRPHFYMPLNEHAGGYLIIGKYTRDKQRVISAFKIPYGYAVNVAPWCIHADSHLIGRYMVIYSMTESYSTVIVRKSTGEIAPIQLIE
ncbi:hypothetical protein [Candidatus Sororendozoicomonas aggregata]|uniref:hypothetical protein n=1 Tax=Candidatus Sororendozoicomonas aggregata TaxID=3073239 RepID=UPI002ED049D3